MAFRDWIDDTMDNNGGAKTCPTTTSSSTTPPDATGPPKSCQCGVKKGGDRIVGGNETTVR